jgi:hypothetical protein
MSGFSTIWTAAVWQTRPWQEEQDTPVIAVVNRGADRAHVTITWLNDAGSVLQDDTFQLDPNQATTRVLFYESAPNTNGWARIVSDQPVAPWGLTPHHLFVRLWANIEFYGENMVPVDDMPVRFGAAPG